MKTLAITFIAIGLIASTFTSMAQTKQISELTKRVRCLEADMVYVGDEFCSKY